MRTHVFTRTDYDAMPEDWRGELVEGALVMAPASVPYHEFLAQRLVGRLHHHLHSMDRIMRGPVDVVIDNFNVYHPDLLVLPEEMGEPDLDWRLPTPLWVVEVLSPSTAKYDREQKFPNYAKAGVVEGWLVAPRTREIEIHDFLRGKTTTCGAGDTAHSLSVAGFALPVDDLFG